MRICNLGTFIRECVHQNALPLVFIVKLCALSDDLPIITVESTCMVRPDQRVIDALLLEVRRLKVMLMTELDHVLHLFEMPAVKVTCYHGGVATILSSVDSFTNLLLIVSTLFLVF